MQKASRDDEKGLEGFLRTPGKERALGLYGYAGASTLRLQHDTNMPPLFRRRVLFSARHGLLYTGHDNTFNEYEIRWEYIQDLRYQIYGCTKLPQSAQSCSVKTQSSPQSVTAAWSTSLHPEFGHLLQSSG